MVTLASPLIVFLSPGWFFWICAARQQQQGVVDTSFMRPSHLDCDGGRIACETLRRSGVDSDRRVNGFLVLPESQIQWQPGPVSLMLSQQSLSVRANSTSRMLYLLVGIVVMTALVCWLFHSSEEPEERSCQDEPLDALQSARPWEEAYQNSNGTEREAFDLLFRTGIVPKMDRQSDIVNRGHIEQCVCVADQMIREKPLQEWLEGAENTRRTFEDKLADVYRTCPPTPSTQDKLMPLATMQDASTSGFYEPAGIYEPPEMKKWKEQTLASPPRVMKEVDVCACGTTFPDHSNFCRKCGAKRPEPEDNRPPAIDRVDEVDVCACGATFPDHSNFCRKCGAKRPEPQGHRGQSTQPPLPVPGEAPSPKQKALTPRSAFASVDTVSTVAAVDCGKKTSSSNSPASTVPVLDAGKKKTPLDEERASTSEEASVASSKSQLVSVSGRQPPQQRGSFGSSSSTSGRMLPTKPILEATREARQQPKAFALPTKRRSLSPKEQTHSQSMPLPQTGNQRGNQSEGWPVVMKFPSKPPSSSPGRTVGSQSPPPRPTPQQRPTSPD